MPITLKGVRPGAVEMIEEESLGRILKQGVATFALQKSPTVQISEEESLSSEVELLLEEFQDISQIPQGLPPPR